MSQTSAQNAGWLFGRTLGATIRSWGDLKNAQRGLLWFDSSPLLGPRITRDVERSSLEPVVRLLTDSAVDLIAEILSEQWPDTWGKSSSSRDLLLLGLQSGALEREQRNPQGTSEALLRYRHDTVLAFCIEREPAIEKNAGPPVESDEPGEDEFKPVIQVDASASDESLKSRAMKLKLSQGGKATLWSPLYSFLRRGDVIVLTLAEEQSESIEGWGSHWRAGRPFCLAIVVAPSSWHESGWWGRIGSVLLLDGPVADRSQYPVKEEDLERERADDRERLRTAFRFPAPPPQSEQEGEDELTVSFGLEREKEDAGGKLKTTDDLSLERTRLYSRWLARRDLDPLEKEKQSVHRIDESLIEPIPVGFPGPWRRVKNYDLRATLGEFVEPYAVTIGFFEHREYARRRGEGKAVRPWKAWYPANLSIERFALTSDNLRLGVMFNSPIRERGRASAQRIVPDPVPSDEIRDQIRDRGGTPASGETERSRIEVANVHRFAFDQFKRGMKAGRIEPPDDKVRRREQRRASSFMPAITLNPNFNPAGRKASFPKESLWTLWPEDARSGLERSPASLLAAAIRELFGDRHARGRTTVAAFPDAEQVELYRAADSRDFYRNGLLAQKAKLPIDPAGSRVREALLITPVEPSKKSAGSLLVILTDDSVAAVDVGAVAWLLLAYGDELRKHHLLDQEAHRNFRQRYLRHLAETEARSQEMAEALAEEAWGLMKPLRPSTSRGKPR